MVKDIKCFVVVIMTLLCVDVCAQQQDKSMSEFRTWALTPPMGWNSWDCYFSSVNEDIVMQNARYLVDNDLVRYGWEYVVVDIRWYAKHPSLGGGNYNVRGDQECQLDEYGRYVPAPNRFPSCMKGGRNIGFKAMADSIHNMGLKFGIHIMRGLPKYILDNPSVYKLKGSPSTPWSSVYSDTIPTCGWLDDNLTVRDNSYGQLYYNSIVDLYAEWGVDFIKVDDISRPFHLDEIRMLREAIDQCGRPIVLSLSPGKTSYQYAQECLDNANMWRMMDDLWDSWPAMDAVFNEAHKWSGYVRSGNYADCDMLPLGQIAMTVPDSGYAVADAGRWTRLTKDEQYTMMTLWGICHSPLFFGGEMTRNNGFTLSLLTNEEYHRMHKYAVEARQVMRDDENGRLVWTSVDPETGNRYLAMFQRDNIRWVADDKALFKSETVAYTTDGYAVDVDLDWPEGAKTLVLVVDDGGDGNSYDHGDWIEPTLVLRDGTEVALTGEYKVRQYTDSYFKRVSENKNVAHSGVMKVDGVAYGRGFSTDANTAIFFAIPKEMDVVRFKAKAGADDSGMEQDGAKTSMRFMVFDQNPLTSETNNSVAYSGLISRMGSKSIMLEADIAGANRLKIVVGDRDDGFAYDRANIVNPVLIDEHGNETSLLTLLHSKYESSYGMLCRNTNVEGGKLMVEGKVYTTGLGMNGGCTLVYDLPEGHCFVKFKGLCGYDSSCDVDNSSSFGTTMDFSVYAVKDEEYSFDLTSLGYGAEEAVSVYDVWERRDKGVVKGSIRTRIPSHGVKLFRLGNRACPSND